MTAKVFTKDSIINETIKVEGGYVNDPRDSGGETNFGITKFIAMKYQSQLIKLFRWDSTMRGLTNQMAFFIYDKEFFEGQYLHEVVKIAPALADKIFDIGVNAGKARAGTWLQEALNAFNRRGLDYADIKVDGEIGPGTLKAITGLFNKRGRDVGERRLLYALICQQGAHYLEVSLKYPKNEAFTNGWFDRIDHTFKRYF